MELLYVNRAKSQFTKKVAGVVGVAEAVVTPSRSDLAVIWLCTKEAIFPDNP